MDFILNKIVQKVSERKFNRTQYKVKRLKTISGVIHAVIAEINDENSEILVALSVLEDKNKFKVLLFKRIYYVIFEKLNNSFCYSFALNSF